ncbi:uncharacterized protein C3orf18 homolog isoform X2 [Apis mellifera]|uniref:Uncharacterized protein C3orf18 homolog isoform X2 n=1 Tax=Apis mellifera TaxID=7460 RepID=A0A7M7LMC8_APIME|nr:uncharacterized protein C3orf18 homolog isoform X2 [Apis mellifera]|eukprot:XP_006560021.1 uncharacterized protein C3orf18 homolog isoform X2 [Apis mellifera]
MNEMNTSVTSSIISGMLLDNQNYTNTMTNASNEISETYINSTEENGNIQLWNVSKAVTSLPNNTVISFEASSTNIYVSTTTEIFDEFGPPDGIEYIFVPLGVVVFVIILSAVVIIISRKRKLERLRHRLMPMYNFDPGEEEEDDWETELLEECYNNHQRRQGYQSMDTEENAELFGNH